MKHVIALVVGIAIIFAGILVYALWGHLVIGGLGSRMRNRFCCYLEYNDYFFFWICNIVLVCIQKVGIGTGFRRIILMRAQDKRHRKE